MRPGALEFRGLTLLMGVIFLYQFATAQAEYNMSDTTITDCSGTLYDSGGPFNPYGNNEHTVTVINPGAGSITITFSGTFSFENILDSLIIYDGPNETFPVLGAYTGQTLPSAISSAGGVVTVVLDSDNNVFAAGFTMHWEAVVPDPVPPGISVNTLPACNATQFALSLSSPVQCVWLNTADVTITANGQDVPVSSIQPNCAGGQTSTLTIVMAEPFTYNCQFDVSLYIEIPNACGEIFTFNQVTSFLYQNCSVNATIIGSSTTVCPGSCAEIEAVVTGCFSYSYAWNNGLPATAGPHQVCPSVPTTYSCTITEIETGSSVIKTFTLGIENIDILTPPQTLCQSAPDVILSASGTGEWSGSGITNPSGIFDPDLASPGLNYVYFETASCIDSVALTIIEIQTESVTAACPGSPAFQLNATPGGGSWTGPNTTSAGIFDPVAGGVYEVEYAVNGCTDLLTVNVDTIAGPFILDPICQSIWFDTLSFTPVGGSWSGAGIVNAGLGVFAPSQAPAGNNTLTYAINGCSADFEIFVREINIDYFIQLCPDEAALILDATPVPLGGTWASPDGGMIDANSGNFNPAVLADGDFTYVTYEAPNGCVDTLFIESIRTNIGNDSRAFCLDNPSVPLNEDFYGTLSPEGGTWSGPGVSGNVSIGYSFNPSTAGLGQSYLYYTSNTCEDSILVTIYQPGLSNTPYIFCSTDAPEILAPGTVEGGTWTGAGIVDSQTGLFDPAQGNEGTYYVYWSNPGGCSDSISVTVEPLVLPTITGLQPVYCALNSNVTFSAAPDGGIISGTLPVSPPNYTFNPSTLPQGSYQVVYSITPLVCPPQSVEAVVEIYQQLEIVSVEASDNPVCPGASVSLNVTTQFGYGDPASFNYAWSTGGTGASTSTPVNAPTTINVTVTDGCSQPVSSEIFVDVFPDFTINTTTSDSLCAGEDGFISLELFPPGDYNVTWNGFVDADNFIEAPAGTDFEIMVTDANGCDKDTLVIIPAYSPVVASFSITPNLPCVEFSDMGNITFTDQSNNGFAGTWDFGTGVTEAYIPGESITQAFPGPGEYEITLSIENQGGCTAEVTRNLCIQPEEPYFIPDIFSPNGDERNDTLFVRGIGLTKFEFHLYNRWGEEVFKTEELTRGWDGQHRGQPASSGIYYYTFVATLTNREKIEKTGQIILVR